MKDWKKELKEWGYSSKAEFLWIYVMGGCGCGSSEEIQRRAYEIFENFSREHSERTMRVYEDLTDEVLAHWLDSKKLLEHGTSIGGSWLSEEGKALWSALKEAPDTN